MLNDLITAVLVAFAAGLLDRIWDVLRRPRATGRKNAPTDSVESPRGMPLF